MYITHEKYNEYFTGVAMNAVGVSRLALIIICGLDHSCRSHCSKIGDF
jgi:hypothetical protein